MKIRAKLKGKNQTQKNPQYRPQTLRQKPNPPANDPQDCLIFFFKQWDNMHCRAVN